MSGAEGGRNAQLKHTGLRPGWTTGACATAAATAAYTALLTGEFPDPVTITLPRGQTPAFALAVEELTTTGERYAAGPPPTPNGLAAAGGPGAINTRDATGRTSAADSSPTTAQPIRTRRPSVTGEPDAAGEPVTAEDSGAADEPGAADELGAADEPGAADGLSVSVELSAGAGPTTGSAGSGGGGTEVGFGGVGPGGGGGRGVVVATAGVVKDAGDDPDVTHGALVRATVRRLPAGSGVVFRAGPGVGTVTKPGLPLAVGEPAINPVPRQMMRDHVAEVAARYGDSGDVEITVSVDGGERIARSTWNPRLGILGGLSILGTTGVVVPYSCSAWIDSIRRGVDVARAAGRTHVAGCTGATSERTVTEEYGLPPDALLDMGDFAGAVLKYVRRHPVERLTVCGGFAKLSKLAAGHLDLHSARSQVDLPHLAALARAAGADEALATRITGANTALAALQLSAAAGVPLGDAVAVAARDQALGVLRGAAVTVDVLCIDRAGTVVGRSDPQRGMPAPRER